ncbi:MAG: threonylcarbamoyl-AMP synthase [Magnetococcales bacterium]|nr:threonylcarbamoyl-AMP synthase [Magnetococcales bacterium]
MLDAIAALHQGEVIGLPTETLFGLAADPWHPEAVARLTRLKARPTDKGFILLVARQEDLASLVEPPSPLARSLMARFWPGPLTLVLPARSGLPDPITGGSGSVAVRHSPAPAVQELLALWRGPLISTSANRAGEPPPATSQEVREIWHSEGMLVLDGTIRPDALPSTLLKITANRATLLRHGAIPLEQLRSWIPDLEEAV